MMKVFLITRRVNSKVKPASQIGETAFASFSIVYLTLLTRESSSISWRQHKVAGRAMWDIRGNGRAQLRLAHSR